VYNRWLLYRTDGIILSILFHLRICACIPCSPLPRWIASLGGQLLLSFLRPRIQSICTNLYPTNPMVVKESSLCSNILRDSLDPGALNVMISGTKLPPPRTANELLGSDFGSVKKRQYETLNLPVSLQQGMFEGPVLIAQGILDPLNDAKGRARMFGDLRFGIDVEEINAGHCPHDELPDEVANAIIKWLIARDPFDWKKIPNQMSR
jgi:pimeloyl-ACP methyl ester carboxylesterase